MQNPLASGFRRCFCTSRPHDMFCFGHASARITFDVLQSAACGLLLAGDGVSTEDVFFFDRRRNGCGAALPISSKVCIFI